MSKFLQRASQFVAAVAVLFSATACDNKGGEGNGNSVAGPVVVATNTSGYVVCDDGKYILIRTSSEPEVSVGDVLSYELGEPVEKNLVLGYERVAAEVVGKGTVVHPEPTVIDSAPDLAEWLLCREPVYVEIAGELSYNESTDCWLIYSDNLGGMVAAAYPYIKGAPEEMMLGLDGKYVVVRGYYVEQYRFVQGEDAVGDTVHMYVMATEVKKSEAPRYNLYLNKDVITVPADGSAVTVSMLTVDGSIPTPTFHVGKPDVFTVEYQLTEEGEIGFGYSAEMGVYGWKLNISAAPNQKEELIEDTLEIRVQYEEEEGGPVRTQSFYYKLQQEARIIGTTTFVEFYDHMPLEKTMFTAEGSTYSIGGLDYVFYNNSGKFGWYVSTISNRAWLGVKKGDVMKIDGKGKTLRKVEWGCYDPNCSASDLVASDGSDMLLISEMVEHKNTKETYFKVWTGRAGEISFTANVEFSYYVVRVTYAE